MIEKKSESIQLPFDHQPWLPGESSVRFRWIFPSFSDQWHHGIFQPATVDDRQVPKKKSRAPVTRIPWVKNPEFMMRIWRNLERKCPLKLGTYEDIRILWDICRQYMGIYGNVWDIFEDMINLIPKSSNIDMSGQHLKQAKIPG